MAVDETVGGASANSYGSNAEAATFFATHPYASAWTAAGVTSPPTQDALLIQATYWIDQLEGSMEGVRAASTQALAWPRSGATDANGTAIVSTVIPEFLKRAQFEAALALASNNLLEDTGLEGFERVKVGPLEVELRALPAGSLPAHVLRYLAPIMGVGQLQFAIRRA